MRQVIPQILWIGNAREARDISSVLAQDIVAVIDLAIEEPPIVFPRDIVYCRFPLLDGAGNPPALIKAAVETATTLVRHSIPTLVTCGGGMSRSPAIVAGALARVKRADRRKMLEQVAASGPHDVSPAFWSDVTRACDE
jgi:protein-tyrosine phosphatase